ncbi:MAG TPA: hypothetical protein VHB77_12035 [Planctomycetaceae bacterium]|nr:hypothetical protein [Planctomycetaceae bacterium]
MADSTSRPRTRFQWFLITSLAVLTLVPVYVASVGPACWLREHGWLSQSAISAVYAPLIVIESRRPKLFRPIERYVMWWIDLAGTARAPAVP